MASKAAADSVLLSVVTQHVAVRCHICKLALVGSDRRWHVGMW